MFRIGDFAVYPAQGVGLIEGIETKEIAGNEQTFFIIRILETDIIIMVPTNNVEKVGLRPLISGKAAQTVFKVLKDRKAFPSNDHQTWNRRYREYMERIKTGSIMEVASVLRDLYLLKGDKDLSFGERKMMDTARNLLVKELSHVMDVSESEIHRKIEVIFKDRISA